MPAVAEFESPTCAPGWSKYAGAPLTVLSLDDLWDLDRQARGVYVRIAVERELYRRRARTGRRREVRRGRPRVFA